MAPQATNQPAAPRPLRRLQIIIVGFIGSGLKTAARRSDWTKRLWFQSTPGRTRARFGEDLLSRWLEGKHIEQRCSLLLGFLPVSLLFCHYVLFTSQTPVLAAGSSLAPVPLFFFFFTPTIGCCQVRERHFLFGFQNGSCTSFMPSCPLLHLNMEFSLCTSEGS